MRVLRAAASFPSIRGCRPLPLTSKETSVADNGSSAVMPTGVTVGSAARRGSSCTSRFGSAWRTRWAQS